MTDRISRHIFPNNRKYISVADLACTSQKTMTANRAYDRDHARDNTPFPHCDLHYRAFWQLKRRNVTAPQVTDLLG